MNVLLVVVVLLLVGVGGLGVYRGHKGFHLYDTVLIGAVYPIW
jgi:hypothetical protein